MDRAVWPGYLLVPVKISSHGQFSERPWEAAGKGPGVKTQEKKKRLKEVGNRSPHLPSLLTNLAATFNP